MKIVNWLKAFWISFLVSQNAQRLVFLQQLIADRRDDYLLDHEQKAILTTYYNVIGNYLAKRVNLDRSIFTLNQAKEFLQETQTLIEVMEAVIYGID